MNRRELLAVSAASTLLGTAGCTGDVDSRNENSADENDVPGCTQKDEWRDEWTDDIATGPADPDPDSIAARRDCANAHRPEPIGGVCTTIELEGEDGEIDEFHGTGVEPYPDPPTAFDEESLIEYVHEYERAYSKNGALSRYGSSRTVVSVGVGIDERETQVLDRDDEITAVRIEFGVGVETRTQHGGGTASDYLGEVAVYGIDETGIVRVDDGTGVVETDSEYTHDEIVSDETVDPVEEGVLLECF